MAIHVFLFVYSKSRMAKRHGLLVVSYMAAWTNTHRLLIRVFLLSLQLVLYSNWSKHTLAAQMCSYLSSYFPCKLNPLKHHSHLQPCSFRYLTPVQICLEFKMILPNTFHQSGPLPLFGKDWKETETLQSPGVNYLTSLMLDHSILPSNPEKCLNNINSAGAPNLRSGVPGTNRLLDQLDQIQKPTILVSGMR